MIKSKAGENSPVFFDDFFHPHRYKSITQPFTIMKSKIYLLLFLTLFLGVNSCKDTEIPDQPPITDNPDPDPEPTNLPTLDINVVFPENVNIDLTGAKVIGGLKEFGLQGNSSKVFVTQGNSQLAFLQDKDDNILLLGFINDKNKTLSVQSSAEALAFLGLAGFTLPASVQRRYPDEATSFPGMDEFKKKLSDLYVSDPMLFTTEKYLADLENFVKSIYERGEEIDIRARQINVDPTGYKSGIQVYENDFQSILVRNQYLRDAHAFLYKMSFKDKEGNKTVLFESKNFNQSFNPAIVSETPIDAANKSGGVMGVITDQIAGNGLEVFMKETGPISISLGENESEAEYALRVVGPTFNNFAQNRMTTKELDKYTELALQTFLKEALLPAVTFIINRNMKVDGDDAWPLDLLNSVTTSFIEQYPDVVKKVEEGNYREALKETLENVIINPAQDAAADKAKEKLLNMIYSKYAKEPEFGNFYDDKEIQTKKKTAKFLKAFELMERALQAWDTGRLIAHLHNASPIEEFTVTARQHDIKLLPKEASVTVFTNKDFTVETKTELSDGQAFLYKWSTSGTYGTIRDNIGNNGKEFENGQKTVTYRAEASNIPDDAKETITVVAYVKQGPNETKIGEATSTFTVKPANLVIKPDGVTLVGKEKQTVALYVEWANGDAFEQASSFDYKYEWSTSGKYGMFDGTMKNTTTMRSRLTYQALDEDVEEGEDILKVDVYMRRKDGGEWFKYHTAEGKVKVNNDEKLKILHLPLTVFTSKIANSTAGGGTNFLHASFPRDDNYEAFTVRFYGYKRPSIPISEGRTFSWSADRNPPVRIDLNRQVALDKYIDKIPDHLIAIYYNTNSSASGDRLPDLAARLATLGGNVEVKIKLKK